MNETPEERAAREKREKHIAAAIAAGEALGKAQAEVERRAANLKIIGTMLSSGMTRRAREFAGDVGESNLSFAIACLEDAANAR